MKQKYFLNTFFALIISFSALNINSQTTLVKGDIAIVSYSTGDDAFAFTTFVELQAGTKIYFTDEEADGDNTIGLGEGHLLYTAPTIIAAGTVITGSTSATNFTVESASFAPGNSGDGLIAYQGASVGNVTTFLHAVGEDSGDTGTFPASTLETGDILLFGADDGNYSGTTTGSKSDLYTAINNVSNWTTGGSLSLNPVASFTVGSAAPGITLGTVSGNTNEDGTTATFTAVLNAQPTTNVVLNVSSGDTGEVTISTSTLTFTNGNWDQTQTITASGIDDALIDGNIDVTITLSVDDASSDDTYDGISETTTVTNEDNEIAPSITFNSATSSQTETDATFNVLIPVTVANYSGTQIDISVAASGTAEGSDYTLNTSSLSFTANGSQNISLDINDDADTDEETVILTITETSSVTGLVISQSTHTITITDDETPPVPTLGTVFITEVSNDKGGDFNSEFLELYNNSNESVSLSTSKIIRVSSSNTSEYVFDFGTDESTADIDVTIPAYGFIIISRGATKAEFETDQGSALSATVKYNGGNSQLYFGSTSRRWKLMTGGTANTDDGTLIDDTGATTGVSRIYRNIFTSTNINDDDENGTPGGLEYLVYSGSAWVNSIAMDGTTAGKDAYFYDNYTVSSNASANNIGISSGTSFIVNSSATLTLTGNVTYRRSIGTSNWYLIAAPVTSQDMDTFVSNEGIASGSDSNLGLATYNTTNNNWTYYQSGASGSGNLVSGKGYSLKLTNPEDIDFTGNIGESVSLNFDQTGNRYNLIGNSYTAFLNSATFLTDNTSSLESETVWVWNQSTSSYDAKVTGDSFQIAPTQGFFVQASNGSSSWFMDSDHINHQTSDTFQKQAVKNEIKLLLSDGTDNKYMKLYFTENATTGFDNGYDGELFGGVAQPFAIYSQLLTNNEGKNYQIQSLPNSDFENMVIPIGLNANSGKEITFTAEALNLPSGINVYLEDRQLNTFTPLDETNSEYKFTLTESLTGIGRFYLHTASKALSTNQLNLENVSIYKTNNTTLKVVGIHTGFVNFKLFNVLGKQIMNTSFQSNGVQEISLPKTSKGVYIVQLETEKGKLNKKIILE
ncbi:lamin tail domain-containing protein [uncultured Polaribacter sp.]|uniref:lamin tail domain-containing protein n=1 Tax=uncultured Polaribacter sp. TaxID=174711 RepID=UPI002605D0F5|nr:lamin tail domain-containing protein [uncultured Polaribacter sp.]